jgi:alpha-tubulin suppressor-like RCC1 family protein
MVITVSGEVLACGLNNYAQLGLGQDDTEARKYLTHIEALDGEHVVCVRGGVHHSLVMTSTGGVLSFGRYVGKTRLGIRPFVEDEFVEC